MEVLSRYYTKNSEEHIDKVLEYLNEFSYVNKCDICKEKLIEIFEVINNLMLKYIEKDAVRGKKFCNKVYYLETASTIINSMEELGIGRDKLEVIISTIKAIRKLYVSLINEDETLGCEEKNVIMYIEEFADNVELCIIRNLKNDISEEMTDKEFEHVLHQRESLLMLLFDSIPGAIIFKDGCGKWLVVNKFAVELLGVKGISYKGKNSEEMSSISRQFRLTFPDSKRTDDEAWNKKTTLRMDGQVIRADGSIMNIEISKTPVFSDNGTRKGMLTLAFDVTERKMVEEMQEKIKENARRLTEAIEYEKIKTDFFANISHELRTPINVIFSAIQLLEVMADGESSSCKNNDVKKYTKIMKQNCYRMVKLVNNLIDITKIDAGYYDISMNNCDIISVIENTTISVVEYAAHKGIDIVFDTDVEEKVIACDSDKIERIMLNLLSNAVKFTPSGGEINVYVHDRGESIVISVKDNGIGIPEEKQHIVFKRFMQVDKSLSRSCEGSGIGLSIVKSLVEMHGGTIELRSKSGEGSEFIIALPVRLCKDDGSERFLEGNKGDKTSIEFSDIYS